MYNNRSNYNANVTRRQSARYNTPGKFVPAQDEPQQQPPVPSPVTTPAPPQITPAVSHQYSPAPAQEILLPKLNKEEVQSSNGSDWNNSSLDNTLSNEDQNMSSEVDGEGKDKKFWIRVMRGGVKKVSKKERRRRQNENLRRLLTPKNALMVLNEMMPAEQGNPVFQVEATGADPGYYQGKGPLQFCAELSLEGTQYRGYGENKASARTNAAEQAFRDLVIKKMSSTINSMEVEESEAGTEAGAEEEPPLPMMQLASYALHKLFSEWQAEGYKVPLLRTGAPGQPGAVTADDGDTASVSSQKPKKVKEPRQLPTNAADMHPCMLLAYMRSGLAYHDVAMEGAKPQNVIFTVGVVVDGQTFLGKAGNKKEARKIAARAACQSLFGLVFSEQTSNVNPAPIPPAAAPVPAAGWGPAV